MRLFLAVPISSKAKELIVNTYRKVAEKLDVKWIAEENIHITLKFLGNVDKNKTEEIEEMMNEVKLRHKPCKFTITSIGAFPSLKVVRVLFYNIEPPEPFISLSNDINNTLEKIGFQKDEKYTPHITIARFKNPKKDPTINYSEYINWQETMEKFNLMESTLFPTGPVYSIIREFKLKGV